jgi:hypothetical protein
MSRIGMCQIISDHKRWYVSSPARLRLLPSENASVAQRGVPLKRQKISKALRFTFYTRQVSDLNSFMIFSLDHMESQPC